MPGNIDPPTDDGPISFVSYPAHVCCCPGWPESWWLVGGEWLDMGALDPEADPYLDAITYQAMQGDGWVIGCPECHAVFAADSVLSAGSAPPGF